MARSLLRIGAVAAMAGVSTRTVDYYTALGLITPAARTDGSFRLYDPATVERITTIRHLETLGVPLDEITRTLPSRTGDGLATLLTELDRDLGNLRSVADAANLDAHDLLLTALARAHSLITAALDIAGHLPPGG